MNALLKNAALALAAVGASVVLAEGVLRLAAPRYEYAAASVHQRDAGRMITRRPDTAYTRAHPDTGVRHPVIHNNLGMRQHRTIPLEKAAGEVRVGIFGDSFTENARIAAPYAFSEVLDHLLNASGGRFTVLNFGVDGYATDQSWLYYQSAEAARDLDVVLYVFATNDVRGLYENDLLELGADGEIVRKPPPKAAWWIPIASRLYLTYLAIDVRNRIAAARGETDASYDPIEARVLERMRSERDARTRDATSEAIADDFRGGEPSERSRVWVRLLQAVVERWRGEVEGAGGRFYVVLLPRAKEGLAAPLFPDARVINLWEAFQGDGVEPRSWVFRRDGHWNELGNQLAAIHIYQRLAADLGLVALDDTGIRRALGVYYSVFDDTWRPTRWVEWNALDPGAAAALRRRYAHLEDPAAR